MAECRPRGRHSHAGGRSGGRRICRERCDGWREPPYFHWCLGDSRLLVAEPPRRTLGCPTNSSTPKNQGRDRCVAEAKRSGGGENKSFTIFDKQRDAVRANLAAIRNRPFGNRKPLPLQPRGPEVTEY